MYRVQIGAFSVKENAENMLAKAKAAGFTDAFIKAEVISSTENIQPEAPKPTQKSVDELAREVLDGKWGNGYERKNRLQNAGYDYSAVQKKVNELLKN